MAQQDEKVKHMEELLRNSEAKNSENLHNMEMKLAEKKELFKNKFDENERKYKHRIYEITQRLNASIEENILLKNRIV